MREIIFIICYVSVAQSGATQPASSPRDLQPSASIIQNIDQSFPDWITRDKNAAITELKAYEVTHGDIQIRISCAALREIAAISTLQKVTMQFRYDAIPATEFADFAENSHVRSLNLVCFSQLTPEAVGAIAHMKELTDLSLSYCRGLNTDLAKPLAVITDLRSFAADQTELDSGFSKIVNEWKSLEHLSLVGTSIDDTVLLAASLHRNLRWIDVSVTQISDVGLASLAQCASLKTINISNTKITYRGLHTLCSAIDLRHVTVSDDVVDSATLTKLTAEFPRTSFDIVPVSKQLGDPSKDAENRK